MRSYTNQTTRGLHKFIRVVTSVEIDDGEFHELRHLSKYVSPQNSIKQFHTEDLWLLEILAILIREFILKR